MYFLKENFSNDSTDKFFTYIMSQLCIKLFLLYFLTFQTLIKMSCITMCVLLCHTIAEGTHGLRRHCASYGRTPHTDPASPLPFVPQQFLATVWAPDSSVGPSYCPHISWKYLNFQIFFSETSLENFYSSNLYKHQINILNAKSI